MPAALVRLWKVGGCGQPIVQGRRRVKPVDFREVILGKFSNGGAVDGGAPFPLSSLSFVGFALSRNVLSAGRLCEWTL